MNSVNAQTPTPEYEPTYNPIVQTETPPPPVDPSCPGYQPIGYGTKTPSWEWMLNCAQCITPGSGYNWPGYVFPTVNPTYGFSTPQITPTRTPVGYGNTPTPTQDPNDKSSYTTLDHTYLDWLDPEEFYSWSDYDKAYNTDQNPALYFHNTQVGIIKFNLHWTFDVSNNAWGNSSYTTSYGVKFQCPYSTCTIEFIDGANEGNTINLNQGQEQTLILKSSVANQPFSYEGFFEVDVTIDNSSTVNYSKLTMISDYQGSFLGTNIDKEHNYYWVKGHQPETTPTPTPTPVFCGVIQEEDPGQDEEIFKLPSIVVGDPTCLTLGGWTIPLAWLENIFPGQFEDWTMQGIQFCFAPLNFGDLNMFGIEIDLDFIAAAMAGILLIRVLTRS